MKSIGTNPNVHGGEGDERIRTAVPDGTNDPVYERCPDKTEIARLTQERDWKAEERDGERQAKLAWKQRAEAAERELARLREGLRPESLARFWWWWLVLGFMLGTLFGYGLAVAS